MNERRSDKQAHDNQRRSAPAAARNIGHILAVLADWLPPRGLVLEVASGTGEHALAFAAAFPHLEWQPSDAHRDALQSIAAWREASGGDNLAAPMWLDASSEEWPIACADAVVAVNLVHICEWTTALGLLDGAARLLRGQAPLILYGPWIEPAVETAASNNAFDLDLRARNPAWGLREVDQFVAAAHLRGFDLAERRVMPANNLMLLMRRR